MPKYDQKYYEALEQEWRKKGASVGDPVRDKTHPCFKSYLAKQKAEVLVPLPGGWPYPTNPPLSKSKGERE